MNYGGIAIVIICVFILFIGVLKQKAQFIFDFAMRGILGVVGIHFVNEFLKMQGFDVMVGINLISFLTVGTLGISGLALLYGIMFYKNL